MSNNTTGSFIPIIFDFDVSNIDVQSEAFKELLVRLYQYINTMSVAINIRESGYFPLYEYINGQQFFPNPAINPTIYRSVFRKVINFGTLPNIATKSVPHQLPINNGYTFTHIYATASDTTGKNYIPIPYASVVAANEIEMTVDATNVNITTGTDRTNFTVCYVVLEYMKF